MLGLIPLLREVSSRVYLVWSKYLSEVLTLDGDRDAATKIRELLPGYKVEPDVMKSVEERYREQEVVFSRDGNCFYTNTDSDKSIALCKLYASKTSAVLPPDKQIFFAACRRDNCLFMMLVDFKEKISPIPIMIYAENGKVKIKTATAWETLVENMLLSLGYRFRKKAGTFEIDADFESVTRDIVRGLTAIGLVLKRSPAGIEYELDKAKIEHELKI